MMDRFLSAFVAVSLALLVWLYARSRDQEILDNVPLPVQVTLAPSQADDYNLELNGAPQVPVSFAGPPLRIRELRGLLQRNELHVAITVTVPEDRRSESRYADTIVIEANDIHAPPGVTPLVAEGRNRIPVTLHRLAERLLPVRFEHAQEEPIGPEVVIEPATVLVRGPQEVLDRAKYISTQLSELPARSRNASPSAAAVGRVPILEELERRPVRATPNRVTVRVPAQPRKVYELADVPIRFLCPPNFAFRPRFANDRAGQVSLRVQGPVQDEPPKVNVYIDLTRGRFTAGNNHEPLQLQLPKDFQLAQEPPRTVAFDLQPADAATKRNGSPP
jgi:hypothetical protein